MIACEPWGCQRRPQPSMPNSATDSANRGVVSRRWSAPQARNSLKRRRPALGGVGRVRLEGCCSVHLSYGRVTAQQPNTRRLRVES